MHIHHGAGRFEVALIPELLGERRFTPFLPLRRRLAPHQIAVFAQCLGAALNLNLHFHALVLDSAFVSPRFQPAAPLADAGVVELVEQVARRITNYLERQGRLPRAHAPVDVDASPKIDPPRFDQRCAASIQGGAALGLAATVDVVLASQQHAEPRTDGRVSR